MIKIYNIELNGVKIGTTDFEFADTSMGVIHGKINFENVKSPYELFRNHCKRYKVQINDDEPKLKLIDTVDEYNTGIILNKNFEYHINKDESAFWTFENLKKETEFIMSKLSENKNLEFSLYDDSGKYIR